MISTAKSMSVAKLLQEIVGMKNRIAKAHIAAMTQATAGKIIQSHTVVMVTVVIPPVIVGTLILSPTVMKITVATPPDIAGRPVMNGAFGSNS